MFKNSLSHSRCWNFVLCALCLRLIGKRFCIWPPPSAWSSEWMATAEEENFIGSTPCLCVRVCMCVWERGRDSGGAATRAVSLGTLSGELTAVLSSSATGLFFSFLPLALLFFSSTTHPVDFLPLLVSLGNLYRAERGCRDSPATTAREG